jgi:hypothetical protein
MPIDPTIPLSAKAPDPLNTLGGIVSTARGLQALQTGRYEQQTAKVQSEQQSGALEARQAVAKVISDPQYHDPDTGAFDLNRGSVAILQADPKNYVASDTISKLAAANNDMFTVKKAALGLADQSRALLGSTVGALATKPDLTKADVTEQLNQLRDQAPDAAPIIDVWEKGLKSLPDTPAALQQVVMRARSQVMGAGAQQTAQTPSGVPVSNGQQTSVVNTNPGAGPIGAPIPGTTQQMQLPPTTPVYDPATRAPGYLGPQAVGGAPSLAPIPPAEQAARDQARLQILQQERAQWMAAPDTPAKAQNIADLDKQIAATLGGHAPRQAFVASGPPLGTVENVAGTVDAVNKDWNATNESARSAQQDIGVLQKIKELAPGAITGVASDRRQYLAGLAGLIGMSTEQMEKTNTDLLAKNTNMLALAGGDTNLAKLMAESANPNTHMTPQAIQDAANQVIAQRKLALAKQAYMSNFKADPDQYTKELSHFNQVADPRILQLRDMSRDEIARMKGAMTAAEQREFGQKIRKMQSMGLVQ